MNSPSGNAGLGHDARCVSTSQLDSWQIAFVDFVADTTGQHGLDASSVVGNHRKRQVQDLAYRPPPYKESAFITSLSTISRHRLYAISLLQIPIDTRSRSTKHSCGNWNQH